MLLTIDILCECVLCCDWNKFYVLFGRRVIFSHGKLNFPNNFLDDDVGFDVIGWMLGSATSICNEENFKREVLALSTSNFLYLHLCIIQIKTPGYFP